MKKSHLLSGLIALGAVASISADVNYPGGLKEKHYRKIEEAQSEKIARQQELARPATYKMMDALILNKENIDWQAVFSMLDSMKGVINVNEYYTPKTQNTISSTLLMLAVWYDNLLATKTLLEKYKANPNIGSQEGKSALMIASQGGNPAMVNLLLKHGGNPDLKDSQGKDSLSRAKEHKEALKILESYSLMRRSSAAAA